MVRVCTFICNIECINNILLIYAARKEVLFDSRQSKSRQLQMGQTHLSTFFLNTASAQLPLAGVPVTAFRKLNILFYFMKVSISSVSKCLKTRQDIYVTIISSILIQNVLII